jgi:hypothetical protein
MRADGLKHISEGDEKGESCSFVEESKLPQLMRLSTKFARAPGA